MFDNVEDAFKQLDEAQYWPFAEALANYRDALIKKDFTRSEAMQIVHVYSKFIYEWALEEALTKDRMARLEDVDLSDPDDDEDDTDTSQ